MAISDCQALCEDCLNSVDCEYRTECDPFYWDCGYSTSYCLDDCKALHPAGTAAWDALTETCLPDKCSGTDQCGSSCSASAGRTPSSGAALLVALAGGLALSRRRRRW